MYSLLTLLVFFVFSNCSPLKFLFLFIELNIPIIQSIVVPYFHNFHYLYDLNKQLGLIKQKMMQNIKRFKDK